MGYEWQGHLQPPCMSWLFFLHEILEEAENERMHLMTAMCLRNPGIIFRYCVLGTQGVFVTYFSLAYLVCPRYCHRLVGYLEEEAVITYTKLLKVCVNVTIFMLFTLQLWWLHTAVINGNWCLTIMHSYDGYNTTVTFIDPPFIL